jgi:hypothetical protein
MSILDEQFKSGSPYQRTINLIMAEGMLKQQRGVENQLPVLAYSDLLDEPLQQVFETADQEIVFVLVVSIESGL